MTAPPPLTSTLELRNRLFDLISFDADETYFLQSFQSYSIRTNSANFVLTIRMHQDATIWKAIVFFCVSESLTQEILAANVFLLNLAIPYLMLHLSSFFRAPSKSSGHLKSDDLVDELFSDF